MKNIFSPAAGNLRILTLWLEAVPAVPSAGGSAEWQLTGIKTVTHACDIKISNKYESIFGKLEAVTKNDDEEERLHVNSCHDD